MSENMGVATPTGDFGCLVCGSIYGHGNLPCPNTNIGPTHWPPFQPVPMGVGPPIYEAKLDRIIELLEELVSREGASLEK